MTIEIGQVWRRNADQTLHIIVDQAFDEEYITPEDDWKLRSVTDGTSCDWVFGFRLLSGYTLEVDA